MPTSLSGLAKKAKERKHYRFGDLYHLINEEFLLDSWKLIRKDAACGVDRVSARDYEKNLEENIRNLVERLKKRTYRAKLVRRQYIPKPDGRLRPLGIPAVEDKLLQLAVARLLSAIYEEDFLSCSYGYRPNLKAHDAVGKLTVKLQFGRYNHVVEADVKGFFDNLDHDRMVELLELRIEDDNLMRLIRKWLKAGVLDTDGKVLHPATGTPQGGIVSPVLANVYLHYALDQWFQTEVKSHCRGEACLIRYADDFVCAFEDEEDAQEFYKALEFRLGQYNLELAADKTRVIPFGRRTKPGAHRYDFLGFEFFWGKDKAGRPHVKRRTSRKKLRNSINNLTVWYRENRTLRVGELFRKLNRKLRGYYNYYAIAGNYSGIHEFYEAAMKLLYKWLNRRSQRVSYNWQGFNDLVKHFGVPRPRIMHMLTISKGARAS